MNHDCEIPHFYRTETIRAAKPHQCCECGHTIPVGELYVKCVGKWDTSGITTYRQHLECCELCEAIRDWQGECFAFGSLYEVLAEYKPTIAMLRYDKRPHQNTMHAWRKLRAWKRATRERKFREGSGLNNG